MEQHFDKLIMVVLVLFGEYILVFLAILADLWSGVRKAKIRKERLRSDKYKRTVEKAAKYYNVMIALTIIDAMQIVGVWYLDAYYGCSIPIFPIITAIGAILIGLIELKSIYEKAEEKERKEYAAMVAFIGEIMKNRNSPEDIAGAVIGYLKEEKKNEALHDK